MKEKIRKEKWRNDMTEKFHLRMLPLLLVLCTENILKYRSQLCTRHLKERKCTHKDTLVKKKRKLNT